MKRSILNQWLRLLELPSASSRFTVDLYDAMYTRGHFIAHYNRQGFYKARFWRLADFDETLRMMNEVKDLKKLIDATSVELIAHARLKVAEMEASVLYSHIKIQAEHLKNLQSQFNFKLIDETK